MRKELFFAAGAGIALLLAGCATQLPPGAEPGPDGTMAFDVQVEASSPGVRIQANGDMVGQAPLHLKIFGDPDGTFHNFNSDVYVLRAYPAEGANNQYVQTQVYRTGGILLPQDRIPKRIYFDMHQKPPAYVPYPVYVSPYPYYYPYYYGPTYPYGASFYYGF